MRLGGIFVAVCMILIAGSGGAVAYFTFGVAPLVAATVVLATFGGLVLYNIVAKWLRAIATVRGEVAELARGNADVAFQVAELGRRLATLEAVVETSFDRPRLPPPPAPVPSPEPLAAEFEEVGTLVHRLADTVAAHETRIAELTRAAAAPPREPAITTESPPLQAPAPVAPPVVAQKPVEPAPVEAADAAQERMLAAVRNAVEAGRVELFLQPIVTLPQRKARFYEALSRIRGDQGELVPASDFIALAEGARLMPQLDNLMIFRCVQVVRRLLAKNREVGLFCNISASTLADPAVFTQVLEFLDANRAIAPSLMLEFTQNTIRDAGPIETESLEALAERGFRFSLDSVTDLRIEPRALATRGFRFVKVPGSLLLDQVAGGAGDIHPADFADLLARFGMELIAEKVESETTVVDLLDYDVRYGQGYLFSPPRPVRAEALQPTVKPAPATAPATPDPKPPRPTGLAQLARRV